MECIKFLMFGFNIIFWAIGATMLGVGIWLAVDPTAFDSLDAAANAGMDNELWAVAVYTFIAIGALVFLLGFLGCWGACVASDSSVLLWIYSFLVGLIVLAEIVIIILVAVYWGSINEEVAKGMYSDVHNEYVSETSEDALSTSWNIMQQEWECCGSYNYTDYKYSKFDNSTSDISYIPYTCCDDQDERVSCQKGISNMYKQGCYDALVEFMNEKAPLIIGLTCGFAALQIIGLIMACCLINGKDDGKSI